MRRCRKMISMIMLMVMLVTMIPSGALAAETLTGATNEIAAVEEPQGSTDKAKDEGITNDEADKSEDSSTEMSVAIVKEEDSTADAVAADDTDVEEADEDARESGAAEDTGLGVTSTEIAAEVEPTVQAVAKDEKAADDVDLWDYFAELPEMGSLEVFVDGKKVDENSEPIMIEWEKEYKIEAILSAKGLAPGSYILDLPSVFTYKLKDKDGNILTQVPLVREDGILIGHYEVEEHGPATLVLEQEINTQQYLGYTLTFYCKVEERIEEEINWHGIEFIIEKPEGAITIKKWNYYDLGLTYFKDVKGEDGNTVRHFHWRTEVQHDKWSTPENCTFTDTLTNKNHKFTDWDKASGQGIVITATKEGHADVIWKLTAADIDYGVFTWDDYVWTYKMPASMNGTTFDEGWKFQFDYWTTQVVKPALSGKHYSNKSEYEKKDWAGTVIESEAVLSLNVEEGSNFNRTGFPDYDKDTLRLKGMRYVITSDVSVDPDVQYGYVDETHYYTYPNTDKDRKIPDEINPGWTDIKVKLTLLERNGRNYDEIKTYESLPVVNEGDPAPAAADEYDGYYAVYFDIHDGKDNEPLGTFFGHKYRGVVIVNKNYEGDPEPRTELGKSMLYGDRASITLEYYQEHTSEFKKYLTRNNVYSLRNTAQMWRDNQLSSGDTDVVSYWGRQKTLLTPPTAANGNIAEFKVGFPISADVSEADEIYFVDEMLSSNIFKLESITLQKIEFGHDKQVSGGKALGEPYAPDPEDVSTELVEKDGKKYRQLRIRLGHEQVYYEVTYKVRTSTNVAEMTSKGIPFDNTFWIDYGNIEPVPIYVPNARTDLFVFSQSYAVTIHKTDESGSPLEGAEFNIYDEEGYAQIPKNVTYSTDESGNVEFSTNVDNGILYDQNHPYYIMETKAPEGYVKDDTKHWFVVIDKEFPDYKEKDWWENYFEEEGIENYMILDAQDETAKGIGTIELTNKPAEASAKDGVWKKNSTGWWYRWEDGTYPSNKFESIDGRTYYFNASGYMVTGWQKIDGKWYYFSGNGAMVTGWQKIDGKWYYFSGSGAMVTGWQKIGSTWYYLSGSGAMVTGWQKINGKWYYFSGSGAMQTGWQKIGGTWYYLSGSGAMVTGWQKINNKWYYFRESGAMVTGRQQINGKWYTFSAGGAMQ